MQSNEARDEDARQYAASQPELDEQFPNRPRNHSKTPPFSALITGLFDPLNESKRAPGTATGNRGGRGGRGGGAHRGAAGPSPHDQRRLVVERFIRRWRASVGDDFYPALRLILPDKDRDRGMYYVKESLIAKLLIRVIKIDKNSADGNALLRWKLPGTTAGSGAGAAGDFALRCRDVLARREMRSAYGTLTVADVNELLDKLAGASTDNERYDVFETLYRRMNAEELMWMVRIVLRQLKVGATEKTLLDIWHPNADALFGVSSSLRRVCWELADPDTRLQDDDVGVGLMQPFQPQLAQFQVQASFQRMVERALASARGAAESSNNSNSKSKNKPQNQNSNKQKDNNNNSSSSENNSDDDEFWIEEKLDGERMQMHMTTDPAASGGKRFGWWSRKGKDYTYLYGGGLQDANSAITRHLGRCFHDGVSDVILDGEMVTWDPRMRKLVTFGTLKTAAIAEQANAHAGGGSDDVRPMFCVFDILYLNGKQLTQYELRDRRKALARAVRGVENRLQIHPYTPSTSADDIERQLRDAVANSSEGLVLKNPRSAYRLNSRNDDWSKVKPEYMAEFGESLDLVIVGGYYGSGHRGGRLSSFLCGLRAGVNHIASGASAEKCWSFCKVGGGFRAEDYAEIRAQTEGRWRDWDQRRPPTQYVELGGGERLQHERPDVWIRPSESVVIEVKAASVTPSDQFAVGKTLRFPRFRKLRSADKRWDQGLSVDEFEQLAKEVKEMVHDKAMEIEAKRKRTTKRVKRDAVIVGTEGAVADDADTPARFAQPTTRVFDGIEFCVLTDAGRPIRKTKAQLEALIRENGGSISQRAAPMTRMVIVAEKNVVKAASLIKAGDVDIVKPKWVLDCVSQRGDGDACAGQGAVLPLEPDHLFHATDVLRRRADANIDKFGDSYAREVGVDELRGIIAGMPKLESLAHPFDVGEFLDEMERWPGEMPRVKGLVFHRCVVYLVGEDGESEQAQGQGVSRMTRLRSHVRFGRGRVVETLGPSVTHVVVVGSGGDRTERRIKEVRAEMAAARMDVDVDGGGDRGPAAVPRVVMGSWVEMCWREGTLVDEDDFAV